MKLLPISICLQCKHKHSARMWCKLSQKRIPFSIAIAGVPDWCELEEETPNLLKGG